LTPAVAAHAAPSRSSIIWHVRRLTHSARGERPRGVRHRRAAPVARRWDARAKTTEWVAPRRLARLARYSPAR
jgi:hypothetical protein